jgi:hypothetical protein
MASCERLNGIPAKPISGFQWGGALRVNFGCCPIFHFSRNNLRRKPFRNSFSNVRTCRLLAAPRFWFLVPACLQFKTRAVVGLEMD